jgi:hypothetical protein
MASYTVKVINSPKGLAGKDSASNDEKTRKTYKNGLTFVCDKSKTLSDSSIWFRHSVDKYWVCYKSSNNKKYLSILSQKTSVTSVKTGTLTKTTNKVETVGSSVTVNNVVEPYIEPVSYSTANKMTSSVTVNNSAIAARPGITQDVLQQNGEQFPRYDHTGNDGTIVYDYTMNITNQIAEDILTIKKNMNIPSAYSKHEINNLMNSKFNRFKINYPDYDLKNTIAMVVFTRPDLNIYKSDKKLLDQISNDPQLYYISRNTPNVPQQLTLAYASDNKFIPLLSNRITALDILDESLDTIETGETFTGFKMQYAKHSIRSLTAGSVSVKFPETYDLAITQMFQFWCSYESGVYRGSLIPKTTYITEKILDYACDIYYFLMDPDFTIRFWSIYYGAFPTNVNKSIFSFDMGANVTFPDVNVTFNYFHKQDLDPTTITEFNENGGSIKSGMKYASQYEPTLGHGGTTWVGAPFIETVHENNGISEGTDIFKMRFRPA